LRAARVALIGARRVRQGLGPFVARYLEAAGAQLAGVLGTSTESAAAAARGLASSSRVEAYTDFDALVTRESPDAVAILSPHATHETFLERALAAKLHVLCEKPLVYALPELAARARGWVEAFATAGLLLRENCQWPYTLEGYFQLHPELRGEVARRFQMRLAPVTATPSAMLADSLSHPLSVLQALRPNPGPDARLAHLRFRFSPGSGPEAAAAGRSESETSPIGAGGRAGAAHAALASLVLEFRYESNMAPLDVELELVQSRSVPRPAALAINGRWAHRQVREPDYALYLTAGSRSVKLADPLGALVERFVAELHEVISGCPPIPDEAVAHRMRLFEDVDRALSAGLSGAGSRGPSSVEGPEGPVVGAGRSSDTRDS